MKRFIKRARGYFKMKFEMFVWRLYDKCADYLDKHSLVIRVDADKLQELEDTYFNVQDQLFDKDEEIRDLKERIYDLENLLERMEEV